MSEQQADATLHAAAALFAEFVWQQAIPLLVFVVIFGGIVWIMIRAQGLEHFDASQFLRDDRGQLAWKLLIGAACFAVHSWAMVTLTIARTWERTENLYLWMWGIYVGIWSGSVVVLAAIEAWRSVRQGVAPAMPPADLGGFAPSPVVVPSAFPPPPPDSPR